MNRSTLRFVFSDFGSRPPICEHIDSIAITISCSLANILNLKPVFVPEKSQIFGNCNQTRCSGRLEVLRTGLADLNFGFDVLNSNQFRHVSSSSYVVELSSRAYAIGPNLWTSNQRDELSPGLTWVEFGLMIGIFIIFVVKDSVVNRQVVFWNHFARLCGHIDYDSIAELFAFSVFSFMFFSSFRVKILADLSPSLPFQNIDELMQKVKDGELQLISSDADVLPDLKHKYPAVFERNPPIYQPDNSKIRHMLCSKLRKNVFAAPTLLILNAKCNFRIVTMQKPLLFSFIFSRKLPINIREKFSGFQPKS